MVAAMTISAIAPAPMRITERALPSVLTQTQGGSRSSSSGPPVRLGVVQGCTLFASPRVFRIASTTRRSDSATTGLPADRPSPTENRRSQVRILTGALQTGRRQRVLLSDRHITHA